jgi:protein arginine N-methyltransferase 3
MHVYLKGLQELHLNSAIRMDGISESESDDDWEEMNDEIQVIECLFCKHSYNNVTDVLKHLELSHNFSFPMFKNRHILDIYSYIKLINFIRKTGITPEELNKLNIKTWENDEYLAPVFQDDPWLMLGILKTIFSL